MVVGWHRIMARCQPCHYHERHQRCVGLLSHSVSVVSLCFLEKTALNVARRLSLSVSYYGSDLRTHIFSAISIIRSGNYQWLLIPTCRNKLKFTDRAFSHAAPTIWNGLPTSVTSSSTLEHFKRSLKSELYSRAFDRNYFMTSRT